MTCSRRAQWPNHAKRRWPQRPSAPPISGSRVERIGDRWWLGCALRVDVERAARGGTVSPLSVIVKAMRCWRAVPDVEAASARAQLGEASGRVMGGRPPYPEQLARAIRELAGTMRSDDLAAHLGIKPRSLSQWARRHGISPRRPASKPSAHVGLIGRVTPAGCSVNLRARHDTCPSPMELIADWSRLEHVLVSMIPLHADKDSISPPTITCAFSAASSVARLPLLHSRR